MLRKKPTLFHFIQLIQGIENETKTRINRWFTNQLFEKRSFKDKNKDLNIECIKESLRQQHLKIFWNP